MPKKTRQKFDESKLTKGQLRKLNALRKSIGDAIGERAFAEWLESQPAPRKSLVDKTAELIATTLWELVQKKKLKIPRGGYLVKRGRGRVIVEPAK
ncbi:MAG: hypothetical protein ACE5JZ_10830 [Kiloniellales bacterium]